MGNEGQWRALVIQVRDELTQAERMTAYAAAITRRYRTRDIRLKWVVAIASCAPFVGQLRKVSTTSADWLLALVPLLALLLPLLNYGKVIDVARELHSEYSTSLTQLQTLWRQMQLESPPTNAVLSHFENTFSEIERQIAKVRTKKVDLPDSDSLKKRIAREIPGQPLPGSLREPEPARGPSVVLYHRI
jgi:hypothetical protein